MSPALELNFSSISYGLYRSHYREIKLVSKPSLLNDLPLKSHRFGDLHSYIAERAGNSLKNSKTCRLKYHSKIDDMPLNIMAVKQS